MTTIASGFRGSERTPAVLVCTRDWGVTGADRAAVGDDVEFIGSVPGVAGPAAGPVPSADGRALRVVVPLSATGGSTVLPEAVKQIRAGRRATPASGRRCAPCCVS